MKKSLPDREIARNYTGVPKKKTNSRPATSSIPNGIAVSQLEHELAIIFLHHRTDAVTRNNLESFRRWNPDIPIVLLSGDEPMEGGISARGLPAFQKLCQHYQGTEWMHRSGLDVMLVDWYRRRKIKAKRWFLVEWDGWCGMPVREFLGEVWEADVVVSSVRWPNREPEWYWFRQIQRLPRAYRPYAVGLAPTCYTMLSDRALQAVSDQLVGELLGHIIYEIRIPTIAHASGYPPVVNPRAGWNVSWKDIEEGTPLSRNLWHPIKWLAPHVPCSPAPNDRGSFVPMMTLGRASKTSGGLPHSPL